MPRPITTREEWDDYEARAWESAILDAGLSVYALPRDEQELILQLRARRFSDARRAATTPLPARTLSLERTT